MTERFYHEMRRYYYTTPSSYLELLKLYKFMLTTKKEQISFKRNRISNGLKVSRRYIKKQFITYFTYLRNYMKQIL